jgi:flagellar hook protein FlgE
MSFNTALSGIRAANTDLQVTGNNIANASTVGFKSSRAEFGDVYTSTLLGGGSNLAGSGVTVQNIRQQFAQGNLKFTQSELDLSINGEGFFVVEKGGERLYTRAGTFGLDKDGNIVTNNNALLQGYGADVDGNINGVLGNLRVDVSSQEPRQTTGVWASYNLNSNEIVKETTGARFSSNGTGIGNARPGLLQPTTSTLSFPNLVVNAGNPLTTPAAPATAGFTLTRTLNGEAESVNITLPPGTTFNNLTDLANEINNRNFSEENPLNIKADASTGTLRFVDLATGVSSELDIGGVAGLPAEMSDTTFSVGIPQVSNDYGSHTLVIQGPNNAAPVTYISKQGASADQTASELNALAGISATARTSATLMAGSFVNNGSFTLNGVTLTSTSAAALSNEINSLSNSTLYGMSASINPTTGDLEVVSVTGRDLDFSFGAAGTPGFVEILGTQGTAQALDTNVDGVSNGIKVGGEITVTMQEGYAITSSQPTVPVTGSSMFGSINVPGFFTPVPINAFDPLDPKTFNHATNTPVYDSLGNEHTMRQYFVKQPYDPADPTTSANHWKMYVQIDGQNVGDPNPSLPSPQNVEPTMASFNIHFGPDGLLNTAMSDTILISNWTPLGEDGNPIGALGPLNVLQGGAIPVAEPPSSSNFMIDLAGTTQFGSPYSPEGLEQNGYATGRLAGLDISSTGIIFARFTNGEAQVLGQVALANFNSVENLKPAGDTMWAQTFETGEPVIGAPGSSQLGNITAGALEESNVDLSEQLVNLIIAQRNYQANAKTIETANAITQTVINLR